MLTQNSRRKKAAVKKTTKRRKCSESSTTMPPGRVMADPPASSKRTLETLDPAPTRVTRHKTKMTEVSNQQESLLHKELQVDVELQSMAEGTPVRMPEGNTVNMDLSRVDKDVVFSEEQELLLHDEGKFI